MVGLTDQLHVTVLNAVVHHLHKVARSLGADLSQTQARHSWEHTGVMSQHHLHLTPPHLHTTYTSHLHISTPPTPHTSTSPHHLHLTPPHLNTTYTSHLHISTPPTPHTSTPPTPHTSTSQHHLHLTPPHHLHLTPPHLSTTYTHISTPSTS